MTGTGQHEENDAASSLMEQLCKAVFELKACMDASKDKVQWTEIEQHFRYLDMTLKKKSEELEAKEKEYREKESNTHALIAEKEAAVAAKELDFLDRVQGLKDAAVAAIAEARANFQATFADPLDAGANKDTKELSFALESASEPARLVLYSLQGFYPPDETTQTVDASLQGMRKSCVVLIEAMAAFSARIDPGAGHLLNPETKQQAKAIACEWKPELSSVGNGSANGNGKSLEVEAFLQLLATFRIASEFDEEELCKLVVVVSHRRQASELCRSIGLTHKMPVVVQLLINSRRHIDAVRFIHAFQLTETFPTVPLLKTYLKDLRRNSQGKGGHLGGAAGPQVDFNALELAALRAVISCVHDYGLEADYPLDPLQKRLAQLEKSKADNKKRPGDFSKRHSSKRLRPNIGFKGLGKPPGRQTPPICTESPAYVGMAQRYPHAGPNPYNFQVPTQPAYASQANDQGSYFYPQNIQANDQGSYFYPQNDRGPAPSYNATGSNYGNYGSRGLQPSNQPYI